MFAIVLCWLVAVNGWTVVCFRHDKSCAIRGDRRISEANLLALALVGGSPGALAARQWFRHKTRKEPFSTQLLLITAIQIGVGGGLLLS